MTAAHQVPDKSTTVSVDFAHRVDDVEVLRCVAADRPAVMSVCRDDDGRMRLVVQADVDSGLADTVLASVPWRDVADLVNSVQDGALDGFEDALDHRPPRGRSRRYVDDYTLGMFEARGRAS